MGKEIMDYIYSQQDVLPRMVHDRKLFCEEFTRVLLEAKPKRVILVGSGTSYNASIAIKEYFTNYLGVDALAIFPMYFCDYYINPDYLKNQDVLVIGISQSGTSVSTIRAIRHAQNEGYATLVLTENLNSLITFETQHNVRLFSGVEEIPIETLGYTGTVLTGYLWALEGARSLNRLSNTEVDQKINKLLEVLNHYKLYLSLSEEWFERNKTDLLHMKKSHIVGNGTNYSTAVEGSLKVYETTRRITSAYEMEEIMHGPHLAFEKDLYLFNIISKDIEQERGEKYLEWFSTNEVSDHIFNFFDIKPIKSKNDLSFGTEIPAELGPLVFVVPFQIISGRLSELFGYPTNKMRADRVSNAHIRGK